MDKRFEHGVIGVEFCKNTKFSDTPKIAVVILKVEQWRFVTEWCVQKKHTEW